MHTAINCNGNKVSSYHMIMLLKCACYTQLQYLSHDHAVAEETHACGAEILVTSIIILLYIYILHAWPGKKAKIKLEA